ncbi:hypothetical protein [Agrobacterium sp. 22-221-1]
MARRTKESVSSSSQWRTPTDDSSRGGPQNPEKRLAGGHRLNLQDQVQGISELWYTPNVPNGGRTLSADTSPTGKTADGVKRQVGLENQANWWATPQARDHFPPHTPEYIASKKAEGHGMGNLNDQADQWMTPRSNEVGQYQYSRGDKEKPVPTLTGQALDMEAYQTSNTWPTPTAMNRPRSDETLEKCRTRRKEKAGQNTVPLYLGDLASRISLPGQEMPKDGETSSSERRSLNPLFVEWLMGWPPGWTLLAWTDFGCSAMELSHWKQGMRSALLSLGLPQEAPPAQLALFG